MRIVSQKTLSSGLNITIEWENDNIFKKLGENFKKAVEKAVNTGGTLMLDAWSGQAKSSLKSSVSYVRALEEGNKPRYGGDPFHYRITQAQKTRDGKHSVAAILEEGIEPFDMKEKILKGRKFAKVRFEYGSSGQSHSQKLSSEIEKVAKRYNRYIDDKKGLQHSQVKEAYGDEAADKINPKTIKQFTALTSRPMTGMTGWSVKGGRKGNTFELPQPIRGVGWFQSTGRTVNYQWKSREFTGMRGEQTQSGQETAVHTYAVYRTISKKSAKDSWIHPGIRPRKILETAGGIVIPKLRGVLEATISEELNLL